MIENTFVGPFGLFVDGYLLAVMDTHAISNKTIVVKSIKNSHFNVPFSFLFLLSLSLVFYFFLFLVPLSFSLSSFLIPHAFSLFSLSIQLECTGDGIVLTIRFRMGGRDYELVRGGYREDFLVPCLRRRVRLHVDGLEPSPSSPSLSWLILFSLYLLLFINVCFFFFFVKEA